MNTQAHIGFSALLMGLARDMPHKPHSERVDTLARVMSELTRYVEHPAETVKAAADLMGERT